MCDPGPRRTESTTPGLTYTAISRATTLGDLDGLGSALYFIGDNVNAERFRAPKYSIVTGSYTEKIKLRSDWIDRLNQNLYSPDFTDQQRADLTQLSDSFLSRDALDDQITKYTSAL